MAIYGNMVGSSGGILGKAEFDTVVKNQADWDNMLTSDTAKNILVIPKESITFESVVTLPSTAQYIKFSAPGADYFTLPDGGCTIQTAKSTQNLLIDNLVQRINLIINNIPYVERCQVSTIQNAYQLINCTCTDKYYNIRSALNCVTSSTTYGTFESVKSCTSCYGYKFISCNNLIGCRGSIFESCDTIVLNSKIKTATFTNCTNVIQETNVSNGDGEKSIEIGYDTTTANGDYSLAVGNEKNGISTEAVGKSSAAIGSGVKTYGRYSLAMGSLAQTGIPDEIKQQSIANYLNKNNVDTIIKVPAADTYCFLKLRNPAYTGGLPEFTPTGENGTYQASDIDLSLMTGDYENYFITYGNNAIINGWESNAIGASTLVVGNKNAAYGHSSVTLGYHNYTWNAGAVALGVQNEAGYWDDQYVGHVDYGKGTAAVALGRGNKAYGSNSAAIGLNNKIDGETSVAIGTGLNVSAAGTIAVGQYNENDTGAIFKVGVGSSASDRKDALIVTKDYTQFKNIVPVSSLGYKTNITQTKTSIDFSLNYNKIEKRDLINGIRIYFEEKDLPVLNINEKCVLSYQLDTGLSYSIPCIVRDIWSIRYCRNQGAGQLPSIAFMPTDSTQQTNLQLLVGATPGQVIITCSMSDIVANELDKYGKVFVNNQTLVGNCGTGDQTTVFAVGNGLFYGNESSPSTERHNAFEVKYNGDVIIDGDILDNDGNRKVLSKASDGCYYLSDNIKIGVYSSEVLQIDGSNSFNINASTSMVLVGGTNGISFLSAANKDVVKIMPMAISPTTTADLVSLDCGGGKISNVATPVANTDAATKQYVDNAITSAISTALNSAV